jgi:NAD(P)-dependent dehydrogenase (short-subunit alcohol dehydrogenase family)
MNLAAEVCLSLLKPVDLADLLILDYTVPAMEVELDEARLTFETNLFSVISMCQTFLPLLIKAKGTIVQIGSIAGVCLNLSPNH